MSTRIPFNTTGTLKTYILHSNIHVSCIYSGDHMVCIIDDREDVWNFAPNLVHVKPYIFFKNVGDINAPEKLRKTNSEKKDKTVSKTRLKKDDEPVNKSNTKAILQGSDEAKPKESSDPAAASTVLHHEECDSKQERRDSIDMPTIGGVELSLKNAEKIKDAEMEGTASVVSDDLELSDDNGSTNSSSSSGSSTDKDATNISEKSGEDTDISPANVQQFSHHTSKSVSNPDKLTFKETTDEGNKKEGATKLVVRTDDHENTNEKSKDNHISATTEDSDSSAKSGMDNDDDEFQPKKDGDDNEKDNLVTEDDLCLIEDTDDYLLYLEDTLKNIHEAYYKAYDQKQASEKIPDLKEVIPSVKRLSLKGTSIVFSGVTPTNIPMVRSKPYLVARSLGAEVTDKITRKTTHLVAARTGTAKVNEAKKRAKNVHLVTPDWLWCCAERWERIDERLYPLYKSAPITVKPPAHCSSPEDNASDRIAEDDPSTFDFTGRPKIAERLLSSESMPESNNPFFTLSAEDFKGMDKEVEDILSNESSSSSDEDESSTGIMKNRKKRELEQAHLSESSNSSDAESLTGEYPRGMKRKHPPDNNEASEGDDEDEFGDIEGPRDGDGLERFKQGGMVPDDFDIEPASDDEDGEEDRAMAEQLEREFMEGEDSLSNSNF